MKIVVVQDPDLIYSLRDEANGINSYHNLVTASISSALMRSGQSVVVCEATIELENQLRKINHDLVFNTSSRTLHGSKHAFVPGLLERLKIPFTGPSSIACSDALDKQKTFEILKKVDIPTPQSVTYSLGESIKIPSNMIFPLFIKPQRGGCSKGITSNSLIKTEDEAFEKITATLEIIREPVVVQEFLAGREFTVGILGNDQPRVLPIFEFIFQENELPYRSYSRKMVNYEIEDEICLAQLNEASQRAFEDLARRAFSALKCRDYARIDIRMNKFGTPFVLEVNAIPNLEPEKSSFALMAKQAGLTFDSLIDKIIKTAFKRYAPVEFK
jgi:D-alanine--D-alanine ligase